jgi:hypothetical protein
MPKLCQILAIENGAKAHAEKTLTDAHLRGLKPAALSGLTRTHRKINDEDTDLPGESVKVQVSVTEVLNGVQASLTKLFDVTATKDWTNCKARGTVVVDGETLLEDVPVSYLLFLEKQMLRLEVFIAKLPTLDPAESWDFDANAAVYATKPQRTTRTKKIPRNHVLAEATDRHPAQVERYDEDMVVGYWEIVKYSGALPAARVAQMLERVRALAAALKMAREAANVTETDDKNVGKTILDFVFA